MLKLIRYQDLDAYNRDVLPFLMEDEADHHLMLAILSSGFAQRLSAEKKMVLSLVREGEKVCGAALQTPPFPLLLSRCAEAALPLILNDLVSSEHRLPGVNGPKDSADRFAALWSERTLGRAELKVQMRNYVLQQVEKVPTAPGAMRKIAPEELPFFLPWFVQAHAEMNISDPIEAVKNNFSAAVLGGREFVWEDGRPVSMAGIGGTTPNGMRVGLVFTPQEYRGRGYATSCVAGLCRRMLAEGKKFCFLFTDQANPVSNSIYQKIGFRFHSDWTKYDFIDEVIASAAK